MKIEAVRRAIINDIQALFPGSSLSGPHNGAKYLREAVSFDTAHRIRIYPQGDCERFFLLKRPTPFSYEEKEWIADIVAERCGTTRQQKK